MMNEKHETLKNSILDAFIPSREMKDYLKTRELSKMTLFEIIAGSLKCLDCKLYWIRKLFSEREDAPEERDQNQRMIFGLQEAVNELVCRPGEIFTLVSHWYDEDINGENSYGIGPFSCFSKAIEYIKKEIVETWEDLNEYPDPLDTCCWYTLKKWAIDAETQEYTSTYTYYLIGTAVIYYRKSETRPFEDWFGGSTEPNLPIPFRQGDIVDIDCRPFHPVVPALIVTVGDNMDCCCVQGMVPDPDGKWRIRALKHNTILGDLRIPMVSPLYSLRKSTGEPSVDRELLFSLSEELKWEQMCAGADRNN